MSDKKAPQTETEHANNPTTNRPNSPTVPNAPTKTPGQPSDVDKETRRIDQTDGLKDVDGVPPNKAPDASPKT